VNSLSLKAVRVAIFGYLWFFAVIFLPAWTLDYWQGWAFFLTLSAFSTLVTVYIALHDQELLGRRLRMGPMAEKTPKQKMITALGLLVFVAGIVVMVFDHRFRWSPPIAAPLSISADIFGALGILIYFFVVRENGYAASTIEVAEGQTVVWTGPYAVVRHPMYAGAIMVLMSSPLALDSWWGLLFVPLIIGWFVWRLLNEEKFLLENLPGY
jgi:protein-S-isoprenylcysteine O-methyltransferase Ste14